MATRSALTPATRAIIAHDGVVRDGVVSLAHTIFLRRASRAWRSSSSSSLSW